MADSHAQGTHRREIGDHLDYALRVIDRHRGLDASRAFVASLDFTTAGQRIAELRARFNEPFRLAVVGDFKAGKSALINALLFRAGLVPEGATPTTGAITEIWWGEEEGGQVFGANGETLFSGSVAAASCYADQRTPEGKRVSPGTRIVLRVNCELLHDLVILDTPGLGANERDDAVTLGALHLCDAAILVVNGLAPGGESSVVLAERLLQAGRKMVVVVTRKDRAAYPADSLEEAKSLFGDICDGSPIAVASPAILQAWDRIRRADEEGNSQESEAARQALHESGYVELRDRLAESFIAGKAVADRGVRTLSDLNDLLHRLRLSAVAEATLSEGLAGSLLRELSDEPRRLDQILRPKIPLLEAKIEDDIDRHVGEFIADLGAAIDVFIDQVVDGGLTLGVQVLWAKASPSEQQLFQQRLGERFRDLFPDSQVDLMMDGIERTVRRLLEFEWQVILQKIENGKAANKLDATKIVAGICGHVAQLTLAIGGEMAAFVALLFVPGGVIIDMAVLVLSLGFGKYISAKGPARIELAKRDARVRLQSMRKTLRGSLTTRFHDLNRKQSEVILGRASETADRKEQERVATLASATRWHESVRDLDRLAEPSGGGAL